MDCLWLHDKLRLSQKYLPSSADNRCVSRRVCGSTTPTLRINSHCSVDLFSQDDVRWEEGRKMLTDVFTGALLHNRLRVCVSDGEHKAAASSWFHTRALPDPPISETISKDST